MALYKTIGTISYMSEIASGTSKTGREWQRMSIILDIPGYQGSITKISFNVDSSRIEDVTSHKVGDKVEVGWTIYAREYKERWYNSVDLVTINAISQAAPAAPISNIPAAELEPHDDDLPFE